MNLREEVLNMKKEVEDVKEKSLAMELLQDARKTNKRLFIIWLVTFIAFIGLLGYTIWLLNDIGTEETTTETYDITQDTEDGGNNNFVKGNNNEAN